MINRYRTRLKIASLLAVAILAVPSVTHADVIGGVVYLLVINLFGMLVAFGAMLLNVGIDYFVIGFGGTFNNTGIGVAVNDTWAIIRDFVNLGFIFGLVYIGIKMILDTNSANARRWLAKLVMAALLVNFSLFATKFVIDIGNRLSAEIAVAGLGAKQTGENTYKSDVGSQLMHRMGITSAYNLREHSDMSEKAPWGYIFGIAILFMIAAFVFAAGGFLLIIRFVVLMVYLITSPLMFVGWIIPGLPDQMNKYWKDFLAKVFFAPIYFVFLYFSFQIMDGLQKTIKGPAGSDTSFAKPDWGGLLTLSPQSDATTAGTLPFFILICVLLIGSLKTASSLGKGAADWSQKTAGKMIFGTVGRVGRNTVGRGMNKIAESDRLKNDAATGGFVRRNVARGLLATGGYGAKASFDLRGAPQGGALNAGPAAKGGYAGQVKKAKDDALKRAKGFGEVDIDSVEGKEKVENQKAKVKERLEKEKEEKETEKASKENIKNLSKKSVEELEGEAELIGAAMKTFTDELKGMKSAFALGKNTDGTIMSVEDKQRLDDEIKRREKRSVDNQKMFEEIRSAKEIAKEREKIEKALKGDEEAAKSARDNGNYAGYQKALESQKKRQEQLDGLTADIDKNIKNLDSEVKQLDKDLKNEKKIESLAKGEVKYSRQIAYLKTQQDSVWNKKWNGVSGGVVGGVVGGATSILGAGAVVGFSEAGAYGAIHKEVVKAIEKEYGKDGSKKFNKEQKKKEAKEKIEAYQELANDGEEKKGDGDANKK